MSSSGSSRCLFVLIACLVFLGAAARRPFEGKDWFLYPTLGISSERDAIEKALSRPCLRESARALQFRNNSAVHIRATSRFRGPAHPAFPWLAEPRGRVRMFRQS